MENQHHFAAPSLSRSYEASGELPLKRCQNLQEPPWVIFVVSLKGINYNFRAPVSTIHHPHSAKLQNGIHRRLIVPFRVRVFDTSIVATGFEILLKASNT